MSKLINLQGKRFGKLLVVEQTESDSAGRSMWKCVCDCGNHCIADGYNLRHGKWRSCGCGKQSNHKTHGKSKNRIYYVWHNMKNRCYNQNVKQFSDYGGRGVKVCDEWMHDFQKFYDWSMQNGYKDGLTIDRIDTNGNYTPTNCRWVSRKVQNNNRRNTVSITYGNETQTLAEWSEKLNIPYKKLHKRIFVQHWSIEKALTTP